MGMMKSLILTLILLLSACNEVAPTARRNVVEDDVDVKLVQKHLLGVDVADRRKGWWLGMAGAMAFNILLLATLIGLAIWWFEPLA